MTLIMVAVLENLSSYQAHVFEAICDLVGLLWSFNSQLAVPRNMTHVYLESTQAMLSKGHGMSQVLCGLMRMFRKAAAT